MSGFSPRRPGSLPAPATALPTRRRHATRCRAARWCVQLQVSRYRLPPRAVAPACPPPSPCCWPAAPGRRTSCPPVARSPAAGSRAPPSGGPPSVHSRQQSRRPREGFALTPRPAPGFHPHSSCHGVPSSAPLTCPRHLAQLVDRAAWRRAWRGPLTTTRAVRRRVLRVGRVARVSHRRCNRWCNRKTGSTQLFVRIGIGGDNLQLPKLDVVGSNPIARSGRKSRRTLTLSVPNRVDWCSAELLGMQKSSAFPVYPGVADGTHQTRHPTLLPPPLLRSSLRHRPRT